MRAWLKQHDITVTECRDLAYDPPLVSWIATKIQPVSASAPTKADAAILLAAKLNLPTWH